MGWEKKRNEKEVQKLWLSSLVGPQALFTPFGLLVLSTFGGDVCRWSTVIHLWRGCIIGFWRSNGCEAWNRVWQELLLPPTGGQSLWVSTHCPPQADSSKGCQWGAIVLFHHSTMIGGCIVGGSAIWNLLSSHRVIDSDGTKISHSIIISPNIVQWFTMSQSEVQSEGFWYY